MITIFAILFSLNEPSIMQEAARHSYFYKNVDILEGSCKERGFPLSYEGIKYCLMKRDKATITAKREGKDLLLSISPDPTLIRYLMFLRKGFVVKKIALNRKQVRLRNGASIDEIQILGIGAEGPVVIYERNFGSPIQIDFKKDILQSINILRGKAKCKPLTLEKNLKKAAKETIPSLTEGKLSHYSTDYGGLRHRGVRSRIAGENLLFQKTKKQDFLSWSTHLLIFTT